MSWKSSLKNLIAEGLEKEPDATNTLLRDVDSRCPPIADQAVRELPPSCQEAGWKVYHAATQAGASSREIIHAISEAGRELENENLRRPRQARDGTTKEQTFRDFPAESMVGNFGD